MEDSVFPRSHLHRRLQHVPAADTTNQNVQMTSSAYVKVARIVVLTLNASESVSERIKAMTVTMMMAIGKTRPEEVAIRKGDEKNTNE